ncbi:MAG: RNA polymerase sigma factor [Thermoguttaceae bacterium]
MTATQASLLERLRDGSAMLAWEEFFERYSRAIYALARSRGCSDHTADEVVQEVMLTIFEQRELFQYDPSRGRFRDWLATVVRNEVATRRRRASERIRAEGGQLDASELAAGDPSPDADWEAIFERAMLAALLDVVRREFSPETYQAFELLTLEGLPGRQAAAITGLSRNAVYLARRRVLQRLRELGSPYRKDGQLAERVKEALAALPDEPASDSMTTRLEKTLHAGRMPE